MLKRSSPQPTVRISSVQRGREKGTNDQSRDRGEGSTRGQQRWRRPSQEGEHMSYIQSCPKIAGYNELEKLEGAALPLLETKNRRAETRAGNGVKSQKGNGVVLGRAGALRFKGG